MKKPNPIVPLGEGPSAGPISLRVPKGLMKRIQKIADDTHNSRSEAMIKLLRWACDAYDKSRAEEEDAGNGARPSA
jgi:metal-responsive CopG/Arc/MetJ family transcriptional regulator